MDSWKKLNLPTKIVLILIFVIGAAFVPEMMLLIDLAGVEFVIVATLMYYKPVLERLRKARVVAGEILDVWFNTVCASLLGQPRYFFTTGTLVISAIYVTSAVSLIGLIWLPALIPYTPALGLG